MAAVSDFVGAVLFPSGVFPRLHPDGLSLRPRVRVAATPPPNGERVLAAVLLPSWCGPAHPRSGSPSCTAHPMSRCWGPGPGARSCAVEFRNWHPGS
ncbi:MAG: hypothetical protein ACLTYN_09090 [Dysosmobacter welbionis]